MQASERFLPGTLKLCRDRGLPSFWRRLARVLALEIHRRLDEHNVAALAEESHSGRIEIYLLQTVNQCLIGHDFVVRGFKVIGMRRLCG